MTITDGNRIFDIAASRRHNYRVDPAVTAKALVARFRRESDDAERRATTVEEKLPAAVSALVDKFGVRKVVLFGSLLTGRLRDDSDVDLLVEGLRPGDCIAAMARVTEILGRPVDLVPAETGRREIVRRALSDGRVLHGS